MFHFSYKKVCVTRCKLTPAACDHHDFSYLTVGRTAAGEHERQTSTFADINDIKLKIIINCWSNKLLYMHVCIVFNFLQHPPLQT